ncbi:MAG: hypothetical protein ABUK01_11775 [Leptospirales bacterium]
MLKIGEEPSGFTLNVYGLPGQSVNFSKSTFGNVTSVVSFIDLENSDKNQGWYWVNRLSALADIHTGMKFYAIMFKSSGAAVSDQDISGKKDASTTINAKLIILKDTTFNTPGAANTYQQGFLASNDNSFGTIDYAKVFTYIVDAKYFITDKWSYDSSASDHPISFRQIPDPGVGAYDSSKFDITKTYLKIRLANLIAAPRILTITPDPGNPKVAINTLGQVKIAFSKPMGSKAAADTVFNTGQVTTVSNYPITGDATITGIPHVDTAIYNSDGLRVDNIENVGKIENVVTLNTITQLVGAGHLYLDVLNTVVDANGVSITLSTTTYLVDAVEALPEITNINIVSTTAAPNNFIKVDETATLTFKASETLDNTLSVEIGGQTATISGPDALLNYTATLDITATNKDSIAEGALSYAINSITNGTSTSYDITEPSSSLTFYKTTPVITELNVITDNTLPKTQIKLKVTFNRGVYSAIGASGALTNANFSINFTTTANATIAEVLSTDFNHSGGGSTAIFIINCDKPPNGTEVVQVQPANDIYDAAGNILQNDVAYPTATLDDRLAPTLNTVSISSNNAANQYAHGRDTITLTFAALEDISTPTVTFMNSKPPFTLTGGPKSWTATYKMDPASDNEGQVSFEISNVTDGTNTNPNTFTGTMDNTAVYYLKTAPVVTDTKVSPQNDYIDLTFNRPVYPAPGASGTLDASDFTFGFQNPGTSGATANMGTVEQTADPNIIRIYLDVTGTPDGQEVVTITVNADSVYDGAGNAAATGDHSGYLHNTVNPADVYLRDTISDDGSSFTTQPQWKSPDILVFNYDPGNNLQSLYGDNNINKVNIGTAIEYGQPNYIVLRARNRGGELARNVKATVYYHKFSPSHSFLPTTWGKVGTITWTQDIAPNMTNLIVSDKFEWATADIPTVGHYCLIAIIECNDDPAPTWEEITATVVDRQSFKNFIKAENDVAQRNVNIINKVKLLKRSMSVKKVQATPDGKYPEGFHILPFEVGAGSNIQKTHNIDIALSIELPAGSIAFLEMPTHLTEKLKYSADQGKWQINKLANIKVIKHDKVKKTTWAHVNLANRNLFKGFELKPTDKYEFKLGVQIPEKDFNKRYTARATQYTNQENIGSVSWQIGGGWNKPDKPNILYRGIEKFARLFTRKEIPPTHWENR